MPAKRRLEDLFVRGDFLTFDDGRGDPLTVWLQKLSPVETSSALRRAGAARARIRAVRNAPESDAYMDIWLEVEEWEASGSLVDYLLAEAKAEIETRVEAQTAAEDEWRDEGYLQGLRDAWGGGGEEAWLTDPDSPEGQEATRVLTELKRFADAVSAEAEAEVAQARAALEETPIEDLREQAMTRVIRYRASEAWLEEFHRSEIFYGTHEAVPHAKSAGQWVAMPDRYWTKREDFDRVQAQVLAPLFAKYAEMTVDVTEGKGSGEIPTSSDSSEQPPEPATGISSGLAAVAP